jgi:hypothetical protein
MGQIFWHLPFVWQIQLAIIAALPPRLPLSDAAGRQNCPARHAIGTTRKVAEQRSPTLPTVLWCNGAKVDERGDYCVALAPFGRGKT